MKNVDNSVTGLTLQQFQQTRHARRIYVGGIPPNYADEDSLKYFLNSTIATGLGEDHHSQQPDPYVLTMYLNSKKCFAFVELRSIELASACLDLDGIIYKKIVLKVLRANEYKPELLHPSIVANIRPVKLDLSSFSFGNPNVIDSAGNTLGNSSEMLFPFENNNNNNNNKILQTQKNKIKHDDDDDAVPPSLPPSSLCFVWTDRRTAR